VTERPFRTLLNSYQRLIEISRDLASTLNLETLLNRIVQAAADLCSAEAASILLYDETNSQLYFEATTNLETPLMRRLIVPVENSIAGWIVTQKQPAIINDAQRDPRHFKEIGEVTRVQTRSLLGVPLVTKDRVVGVLEAINKLSGPFTPEDQEVLLALGYQAAVAIENARLFQQSDLISELVHELRTPLTSLKAASHLLSRPELGDSQRTAILRTIQGEINRLSDMATSFLDLARLETGRTQYHISRVDMKHVIEECARVVEGKMLEKDLQLQVQISQKPMPVRVDSDKLKQVILNLLSNAFKYTPKGGKITLVGECVKDEVIVRVRDTGAGIPQESLPFIFEKFYRVPGMEQPVQGTGLGLFICKRIVQAHQGRIEARSQVGKGSEFIVYLPLAKGVTGLIGV
jgi:signal transduction histidine kinase